ncbi:MAG: hypothetical protein AAF705_14225, partial [Bacteroidota bacterium]
MESNTLIQVHVIYTLFSFASGLIFCISVFLIGIESKLKAIEHNMIALFILNFALYAFELLLGNLHFLLPAQVPNPIYLVSWFGFGSFFFLFIYHSVYPKKVTRKHSYLNLLLIFPA